ncbi:MAG: ABC transporter ATP-binding protein [Angelakisella sp.]
MLCVEHLSSEYDGTMVVKDVSFTVQSGERLCVVGPNGCGKSTLLKSIVGLIGHTGEVTLSGSSLRTMNHKAVAERIAFMSQLSSVYFSYSVFETVMLGRYAKLTGSVFAAPTPVDVTYVEQCMEAANILQLRNRPITDLSGGELQRVFLAKAFAQDPDILLLDEPTNHLDLKHQIELTDRLRSWSEQGDRMVIAVLHDLNLALSFADKLLLLADGGTVAYGDREQLLESGCLDQVYGLDVRAYMRHSYGQWN